jgi:thiamine-monophosphate kinase
MKEFDLINKITKIFNENNDKSIIIGPGDDCAVLDLGDKDNFYVFTVDEIVENTHFILDFLKPEEIAIKLVRMNVSDVLSMGRANPFYALVSGGINFKKIDDKWILRFLRALKKEFDCWGIKNIGGNLSRSSNIFFSMKLIGKVEKNYVVYRKGAKEGDFLCVYGFCGSSMAAVDIMKNKKRNGITKIEEKLVYYFTRPTLYKDFIWENCKYFSAMIDNSDGIYKSALILSKENNLKVVIDFKNMEKLVKPEVLKWCEINKKNPFDYSLFGGEDYNPIFSVSEKNLKFLNDKNIKIIGRFKRGKGVEVLNYDGKIKNFEHF